MAAWAFSLADVTWFNTGAGVLNLVFDTNIAEANADQRIDELLACFKQRGLSSRWSGSRRPSSGASPCARASGSQTPGASRTAMMNRLLRDAHQDGCHLAVLQSTEEGEPLYRRLGFQALPAREPSFIWFPQ